ncbi:hypothetical protein [Thermofilum sp.]|jgi:hypothetical protein|uniref:hypothetical protein n=1 Tax=Thermofilum sp. TaxID=1961369 RepID=UPI00258C30C0|nr:hypothetical protein [Thermofilum sp.]
MQRKTLLVTLVIVGVLALALFFFVLQPKLPGLTQLAQNFSQPKPSLFTARIEAGQGGRVIVNGTETATWSSTKPFTLTLEARPGECHVFDHWLVNGTRLEGERLNLTIAGNTTVSAVFRRLSYRLTAVSNASWGLLVLNDSVAKLPFETEVSCGSKVTLKLFPWSNESISLKPLGFFVNYTAINTTETEIRVQGNLHIVAVYKFETHILYLETNAPGVKVLVDGQEVTLPAKIQRAKPFTVVIQAPPLVKVNDTFAWGGPEFQARDYIRGVLTWVTFATGQTPIHVEEAEKTIRVYYHPYYSLGKDTYVSPLYGNAYVKGNTIIAVPDKYHIYTVNIILPPNWTRARVRVESSFSLGAVIMFPYNKNGNIYDEVDASVGAQRGACTKLTAEFEVDRNLPSARVLSYYCDAPVASSQDYTSGPWNFGKGNEQYLGRLIVVGGDGSNVRIQVEVEG